MRVMRDDRGFFRSGDRINHEGTIRIPEDCAIRTNTNWLTVLETDQEVVAGISILQRFPCAIVEDVAVLVDLHECSSLVGCCSAQHLGEVFAI